MTLPPFEQRPRPEASEQALRDVLGGAGWDIESLEPARWRREIQGKDLEMAFWYVRAQRRPCTWSARLAIQRLGSWLRYV